MSLDQRQVERKKRELHEQSKLIRRREKSIEDLDEKIRSALTIGEERKLSEQRIDKIVDLRREQLYADELNEELLNPWED